MTHIQPYEGNDDMDDEGRGFGYVKVRSIEIE